MLKMTRTTRERFNEMYEILPPTEWVHFYSSESFKMCERYTEDTVRAFVRLGPESSGLASFWEGIVPIGTRHKALLDAVHASILASMQASTKTEH